MPTPAVVSTPLGLEDALDAFRFLYLRMSIVPQRELKLPSINKGNTLRGAFGFAFRRLVCIPQCKDAKDCPLNQGCPYRVIFEPGPPPGLGRLAKNQDAPRPFVFRPPLNARPTVAAMSSSPLSPNRVAVGDGDATKTTYKPGESFEFGLILLGKAVDFLPYFVLAFREITRQGFGLNRAPCQLREVRAITPFKELTGTPQETIVYNAHDELFHTPQALTLGDYVHSRLAQLSLSNVNCRLAIDFLTPTSLKSQAQTVHQPEFHHLFKRVRDRLNALCTFYGPGPIEADFKGLGQRSEQVRIVAARGTWAERSRRSLKTHQRHELSGFVGECIYELTSDAEGMSNREIMKWLLAGEMIHAGRHTAWGNGWYGLGAQGC